MSAGVLAVIPARYASTRLPGKPLADVAGRSLIERCWRAAQRALVPTGPLSQVVVATDDRRIADHVAAFGGEVWMTRADHPSGTDRLLELADRLPGYSIYVNLQGDEPFVTVEQISQLVAPLIEAPADAPQIATLVKPITDPTELANPNAVKAVVSAAGHALYFSRRAVPYVREGDANQPIAGLHHKHLGLYAFTARGLASIRGLAPSPLELAERLEQLRWLEAGLPIATSVTLHQSPAIDTPEDLAYVTAEIRAGRLPDS